MTYRGLLLSFLCTLALTATAHASTVTGGTIRFNGSIKQRAVAMTSILAGGTTTRDDLALTTVVLPLSAARQTIMSDMLNFFATYAVPNAKLVSTTYQ